MNLFISYSKKIEELLESILSSNELHAKWLNTLSFLENCGARKIAACEHPTLVKEEMLKHAAEEFRHAHYLKRQIEKISSSPLNNYSNSSLLGGFYTLNYLNALDLNTSRYLQMHHFSKPQIKEMAYLLVTYAIELRAAELYPIYDALLRKIGSRIAVKSILLEEKEHLEEMNEGLEKTPCGFIHAAHVCAIESHLFAKWVDTIKNEMIKIEILS